MTDYLGVEYISLFMNGTLPLVTAFQVQHIGIETITTPYSFVAPTAQPTEPPKLCARMKENNRTS